MKAKKDNNSEQKTLENCSHHTYKDLMQSASVSIVNIASLKDFHRQLQRWYAAHGRKHLPWRHHPGAYAVYVSETMLQQTQVVTVLERYYFPFLKRFPTLKALADAPRQDVLRAWQGLGYYNRAIHLHEAARRCQGKLPETVEELIALPGIGRNTAHAIAAFAFHQPVAVMEANVRRVLSRIFAMKNPKEAELWEKAHALLNARDAFDYNQAMMDIGALICTKHQPKCDRCPASGICAGKASPESYPVAKKKKTTPVRQKTIVLLSNPRGEYFATPRASRFLNGLYHFQEDGRCPRGAVRLGHIRQQYSHFTLEAEVFLAPASGGGKNWHSMAKLKRLPFSNAERKILALLEAQKAVRKRA